MGVLDHGAREDVFAAKRALGVAVLARFGGADLEDLARLGFQYCVAALFDGGGLAGEGE